MLLFSKPVVITSILIKNKQKITWFVEGECRGVPLAHNGQRCASVYPILTYFVHLVGIVCVLETDRFHPSIYTLVFLFFLLHSMGFGLNPNRT